MHLGKANSMNERLSHWPVWKRMKRDDSPDILFSNEEGEYEAIDDVGVNDVEHGQGSLDQGELTNVRRLAQALVLSIRYSSLDYIQVTESGKQKTFSEVKAHENRVVWMRTMQDEMNYLYDNHTYKFITLLQGKITLKNK